MQLVSDREKLKQILANIIQNGMDALGENGSIEIGGRIEGEHVTITVRDNGCGMDAETMAKACDSFFTTKAKGTGLGLAIVTRLVKAIQGTVSIESSPGSGSTVTVRLPLTLKGEGNG
jgi:signal transduction histidine kinase